MSIRNVVAKFSDYTYFNYIYEGNSYLTITTYPHFRP